MTALLTLYTLVLRSPATKIINHNGDLALPLDVYLIDLVLLSLLDLSSEDFKRRRTEVGQTSGKM